MDILECLKRRDRASLVALRKAGRYSAGEFLADIARWRAFFKEKGIDSTVLFCENRVRFAASLLGAWCAGAKTLLPTDMTTFTKERLQKEGHFFVTDDLPILDSYLCGSDDLRLDLNLPLVELFTSGSTGEPTRVRKTLKQVLADIETLDADFPDRPDASVPVFSTVSHQHIYGFLWTVLWPLASARPMTEHRLIFPENIFEALSQNASVILVSSPAHLKRLPLDLNWSAVRDHLNCLVTSGGPLSEAGLRLCAQAFSKTPYEILGSTELDGIAWRKRRLIGQCEVDESSTGWSPMPGTDVSADVDGVLRVRSERLNPNEYTRGSDRIRFLKDGRFELLGRTDRLVKIEEKRLSLSAMEEALLASGLVSEARVLVLPEAGELAVVAVQSEKALSLLKESKLMLVRALQKHLRERFEAVLLPHRWRFEPMMPTNSQGKHPLPWLARLFDPRHIEPYAWTIQRRGMTLYFKAAPKLPYFDGHFPKWPIMPGVAQVQIALSEAARYLKTPVNATEVTNLKFMSIIKPGATLRLTVSYDPESSKLKFALDDENGSRHYSCGTIHFSVRR